MLRLLPDIQDKRVLCLGCGLGDECVEMQYHGARSVEGIDASARLIDQARLDNPSVSFRVADMVRLQLEPNSLDFVWCSKAMHYVSDWTTVLKPINRALTTGGNMLLSVHHPATWCARVTLEPGGLSRSIGYRYAQEFTEAEVWGDYFDTSLRGEVWQDGLPVHYYHTPLSHMFEAVKGSGMKIIDMAEPQPLPTSQGIDPKFFTVFTRIPMFLVLLLENL
jgi:SAM-dependent methyltransferase